MNMVEIIDNVRKRRGISREEIAYVVRGVTDGSLPDYQLAAWLMAVCCKGLGAEQTAWQRTNQVR